MSVFGTYYTVNMLRQMKWPRKQGLLKKEVYDVGIVDVTIDNMVDWAAAIGAGNPNIALRILALVYKDRDWDSDDGPNIEMFVELLREKMAENGQDASKTAPHDLIDTFHFGDNFQGSLPSNAFDNKNAQNFIETTFVSGLIYGLSHPHSYVSWYKSWLKEFHQNREIYEKMSLDVEELPGLKENMENALEVIKLYEKEMDISFPPIPEKLREQAINARKY